MLLMVSFMCTHSAVRLPEITAPDQSSAVINSTYKSKSALFTKFTFTKLFVDPLAYIWYVLL